MAIPKKIHYCWFGGKSLPDGVKKYIETWKRMCPDYEIYEWNETNFNINCCLYVKQAYEMKKWAFVADYARFYALEQEGGIYLDTDIEVVKSFDDLLEYNGFFGFGKSVKLTVPVFGAAPHQGFIQDILADYESRHFIKSDKSLDESPIETTVSRVLVNNYKFKPNGKFQVLDGNIAIFPKEYFYSTDFSTGIITKYKELYVIHYCEGSWLDKEYQDRLRYDHEAVRKYGKTIGLKIGAVKYFLHTEGIGGVCKHSVQFIVRRIKKIRKKMKLSKECKDDLVDKEPT